MKKILSIHGDGRMFHDFIFETSFDNIINNIIILSDEFSLYMIDASRRNDIRRKFRLIYYRRYIND